MLMMEAQEFIHFDFNTPCALMASGIWEVF